LPAFADLSATEDDAGFARSIPILKRENGYSHFESKVISSQNELDAFLARAVKRFNDPETFENAIRQSQVDFNNESLVLLRHTEGSGSVRVNLGLALLENIALPLEIYALSRQYLGLYVRRSRTNSKYATPKKYCAQRATRKK
jgi:hypothetical protein